MKVLRELVMISGAKHSFLDALDSQEDRAHLFQRDHRVHVLVVALVVLVPLQHHHFLANLVYDVIPQFVLENLSMQIALFHIYKKNSRYYINILFS